MPDAGSFVTRDGVELMIQQALDPIKQDLTQIKTIQHAIYGNGSGTKGYLERTKEAQDVVNEKVLNELAGLSIKVSIQSAASHAVHKDRREWVRTGLVILAIVIDILYKSGKL